MLLDAGSGVLLKNGDNKTAHDFTNECGNKSIQKLIETAAS
jgi:hypothetical protein